MFAKKLVTQSMIDAVNQVLGETSEETTKPTQLLDEEKKQMLMEPELDETGFHKAAHAAKKAGQSHFEFQGKKYPATAKSHKEAIEMDEAAEKVPTPTGMKVYGSSYGNSAKARKDQTKHELDKMKGPKEKDLKEDGDCVTPTQAKKIADKEVGKHEKGMHKGEKPTVKAESYFTNKLLNSLNENKTAGTDPVFTDNNLGEEEMSDAQMKKREKIVKSMKKGEAGFKQRYGKNWKNVMYATATKQAMKEDSSDTWEELEEGKKMDDATRDLLIHAHTYATNKVHKRVMSGGYKDKGEMAIHHAQELNHALTTLGRGGKLKEENELDEATPPKNTDIADKAYLKHKPGTVKGTLTQIGRFLKGKPEIKEAVETEPVKPSEAHKITTDMLSGREKGGKLNSFKNFKVDLVTSGEETIPKDTDKGEDTREKQKITTNPGPVDIKFDDKLGHPTVQSHYASEHQITHEQVQVDEKVIAGTPGWEKIKGADKKGNIKDKSGAVHTPMSRAKDLARKSFKKLKKETMMGKISN